MATSDGTDPAAAAAEQEQALLEARLRVAQLAAELESARNAVAELREHVDVPAPPEAGRVQAIQASARHAVRAATSRRVRIPLAGLPPWGEPGVWQPEFVIGGEARSMLDAEVPSAHAWRVRSARPFTLQVWIAIRPQAWERATGTVRFVASLRDGLGTVIAEGTQVLNVREHGRDRAWVPWEWTPPEGLADDLVLVLATEPADARANTAIWAAWGDPGLVRTVRRRDLGSAAGMRSRARGWVRRERAPQAAAGAPSKPRGEPGPSQLAAVASGAGPLLAFLMPVHGPGPALLEETLASVAAQSDGRWELCICDDGSSDPVVIERLQAAAAADERVRLVRHDVAKGISGATNAALALATAPFVATLDHDDLLEPQAVAAVRAVLTEQPDADMIYSDNAKIAGSGLPFAASLKPAWSPDLMRSVMYTLHLAIYRRALVQTVGAWRPEYDGAQDHDLVLRISEATDRIVHLPQVLYHWRAHAGSAALGELAKPLAYERGRAAVAEHLARTGRDAEVLELPQAGTMRVRYRRAADAATVLLPIDGAALSDPAAAEAIARGFLADLRADDRLVLLPIFRESIEGARALAAAIDDPRAAAAAAAPSTLGTALAAAAAEVTTPAVVIADALAMPEPGAVDALIADVAGGGAAAAGGLVHDAEGRIVHLGTAFPAGIPLPRFSGRPARGEGAPDDVVLVADVLAARGVVALRTALLRSATAAGGIAGLDWLALVGVTLRAGSDPGERVLVDPHARFELSPLQALRATVSPLDEQLRLDRGDEPDPYFHALRWADRPDDGVPASVHTETAAGRARAEA